MPASSTEAQPVPRIKADASPSIQFEFGDPLYLSFVIRDERGGEIRLSGTPSSISELLAQIGLNIDYAHQQAGRVGLGGLWR